MNTKETQREAVDLHRLVRQLREKPRFDSDGYKAAQLMDKAAEAIAELLRDKERLDWLETQDCWVGVCGEYYAEAVNSCGGCYSKQVREVCDEYLPNDQVQELSGGK